MEEHYILLIDYSSDGLGNTEDLDKINWLEQRMNAPGWTDSGHSDGGCTGSGTMGVCNLVVDVGIAGMVIEEDPSGTEYPNFIRIYDEDTE